MFNRYVTAAVDQPVFVAPISSIMSHSSDFETLLEATLDHLETLKRRGDRTISIDPNLLAELVSTRSAGGASPPKFHQAAERIPAFTSKAGDTPPSIQIPNPPTVSAPPLSPPVLSTTEKEAAMESLKARALGCMQCAHLAVSRKNVVFGVGSIQSPLMFVGEAPGTNEDAQAEPFVGAAGQLLTKIIQAMGLSREAVYIANVLKCRPDTPGKSHGNRKPTPEEMQTCLPYLREQIRIIRPKVVVALGATATEGLFGKAPVYITKIRGQWMEYEGAAVMPTFHPSYVLQNQSIITKREIWEDMLLAMERLGLPISEKQRGYFKS
jgi:uracil-DNA glycosylase